MGITGNNIDNNALVALAQRATPTVVSAIKDAAQKTGVNFAYLLEQAAAESSFKADAKAKTSSASGLYQFIERTWLSMVRDHGDKYGMGDLASQIDAKGRVKDPAVRKQILALRNDPEKAALMAGEFAADNKRYLERFGDKIGDVGATELYFAHFMGAGGAASFLKALKNNPMATGADLFPDAARANYNVFYNSKTGQPRTLASIYNLFDKKFSASNADYDGIPPAILAAAADGGDRTHSAFTDLMRNTAGQSGDTPLSFTPDSAPVLPELSPFAHLNQRRDTTIDAQIRNEAQTISLLLGHRGAFADTTDGTDIYASATRHGRDQQTENNTQDNKANDNNTQNHLIRITAEAAMDAATSTASAMDTARTGLPRLGHALVAAPAQIMLMATHLHDIAVRR